MSDVEAVEMAPQPAAAPAPGSYAALRAAARGTATPPAQPQQHHADPHAAAAPSGAAADHTAVYPDGGGGNAGGGGGEAGAGASDELGLPALKQAARGGLEATKARAAAIQSRTAAAAQEAQMQAQEAAARGSVAAGQAAERAGQMAVAAADVARSQFEQRWADVVAQERQLADRMSKIDQYERQILSLTGMQRPNFPRACCCIEPVVFHDINAEVTEPGRKTFVKTAYFMWWMTCVLLAYNAAIAITMLFVANKDNKDSPEDLPSHLVVAVIMLFGIPLSFVIWYWPIYKACATRASGQHIMSYIGLVVATLFAIIVVAGPMGFGGCGLLYGFQIQKAKGNNAFYPCLVNAALHGVQVGMFIWMFIRMKCKYGHEDKASIARANAEMTRDGLLGALR